MDKATTESPGYYLEADCELDELERLCASVTDRAALAYAADVRHQIPIYRSGDLVDTLRDREERRALMAEWASVLRDGAGIVVLASACDPDAIDSASEIFRSIIAEERAAGSGADHFAAAGSNDRIWNSLQKLAEASPETFLDYHAAPVIDAVAEAWLGPGYQMTAQVNLVHPGGAAQQAHRDYHLGFQTAEHSAEYPAHVHELSPLLTLQGAIAHGDMPIESGPTKLLPFSQQYKPGYAAWRRADFRAFFEANFVQLSLQKGDALFFNPAVFHAAGSNTSEDIHRLANLLQVSSAFGRAMESIDRAGLCRLVYPVLLARRQQGLDDQAMRAVIAASGEGYSFPTNLDTDPPLDGLAPQTQQQLMEKSLREHVTPDEFGDLLAAREARRIA